MKIVFMGTPAFAVESLKQLLEAGFDIAGVVTAPDRHAGRGQKIRQSEVKIFALEHGLRIMQPERLKDEEFIAELEGIGADAHVVVAFRMLPEKVWNMPPLGTFNLHASLLPAYRGAAPINWAIIRGEKTTGVTIFRLVHEIDCGQILMQEPVNIPGDMTAGELHDTLMYRGASLLVRSMRAMDEHRKKGSLPVFEEQSPAGVSHAPKIFKDHCEIHWHDQAQKIHDLIRGLSPYPGAYTYLKDAAGKPHYLKILKSELDGGPPATYPPGHLSLGSDGSIQVACGSGILRISELQLEGRKRMSAAEFLRGFDISGASLTSSATIADETSRGSE